MTTVAFVTYKSGGVDRRVGPLPKEQAEPLAKEWARNVNVTEVRLEEWACLRVTAIGGSAA